MKEIRLKDFVRRAEYSPNSVYRHIERGYRYIPVHPFADETEELIDLGIDKNECWKVDAWVEVDDDACFLQVHSSNYDEYRKPGLYARIIEESESWLYLWATIEAELITRREFENIIIDFVEMGAPNKIRDQLNPGNGLVPVGPVKC
jgi:hypothetical protein